MLKTISIMDWYLAEQSSVSTFRSCLVRRAMHTNSIQWNGVAEWCSGMGLFDMGSYASDLIV